MDKVELLKKNYHVFFYRQILMINLLNKQEYIGKSNLWFTTLLEYFMIMYFNIDFVYAYLESLFLMIS